MLDQKLVNEISNLLGSRNVVTSREAVADRSRPLLVTDFPEMMGKKYSAEVLLRPKTTQQISEVIKLANKFKTPVYVVSGFTDTVGGSIPVRGGILIDLSEYNQILEINKRDLHVRVQPGVQLSKLENTLSEQGLRHGHHPASYPEASVGGPLAYYGAGIESPRYRTLAENVLGIEAVLPTGEILRVDYKGKSSLGESNLIWLFLGTEGQHGIITEVTLRVYPYVRENRKVYLVAYKTFEEAARTSFDIYRRGLSTAILTVVDWPALVEYMPELKDVEGVAGVLIVGIDGITPEEVSLYSKQALQVAESSSGLVVGEMSGEAYEKTMWDYFQKYKGHKSDAGTTYDGYLFPALPGLDAYLELFRQGTKICSRYDLEFFSLHLEAEPWRVGVRFGTKKANPGTQIEERIFTCRRELTQKIIELGGTVDSIHGAGMASGQYVEKQLGPVGSALMKNLKKMLDPNGILNPGKRWEASNT